MCVASIARQAFLDGDSYKGRSSSTSVASEGEVRKLETEKKSYPVEQD